MMQWLWFISLICLHLMDASQQPVPLGFALVEVK